MEEVVPDDWGKRWVEVGLRWVCLLTTVFDDDGPDNKGEVPDCDGKDKGDDNDDVDANDDVGDNDDDGEEEDDDGGAEPI